jgi:hypothetical protein
VLAVGGLALVGLGGPRVTDADAARSG